MIRLALSDLDDTLIPFGAPCADEVVHAAVHALVDAGVRFAPVTGRTPAMLEWMFSGDASCWQTGVLANGQIVKADGEVIRTQGIPRDTMQAVADALDDMGAAAWLVLYDAWDDAHVDIVTRRPERAAIRPASRDPKACKVVPRVSDEETLKACVHCACDWEGTRAVCERLRLEVPQCDFAYPSATATILDVLPHGWDKGKAALFLTEHLGLERDEVMAFGDSENDLPFIEAFPCSVAVANATESVRATARHTIGAVSEGAVAKALLDVAAAANGGAEPALHAGSAGAGGADSRDQL